MTNEKILTKAIEKAIRNGLKQTTTINELLDSIEHGVSPWVSFPFIFSHKFAQAFWGDRFDYLSDDNPEDILRSYVNGYEWDFFGCKWQAHLMMMVLEENPIKYLEQFLEDTK